MLYRVFPLIAFLTLIYGEVQDISKSPYEDDSITFTVEEDANRFANKVNNWVNTAISNKSVEDNFQLITKFKKDVSTVENPCTKLIFSKSFSLLKELIKNPHLSKKIMKKAKALTWQPSQECLEKHDYSRIDGGSTINFNISCGSNYILDAVFMSGGKVILPPYFHSVSSDGLYVSLHMFNGELSITEGNFYGFKYAVSSNRFKSHTDKVVNRLYDTIQECAMNHSLIVKGYAGVGWNEVLMKGSEENAVGYGLAFSIKSKKEHSKEHNHEHSKEPIHEHSKEPIHEHSKEPIHEHSKEPIHEHSKEPIHEHSKEPIHEHSKEPIHKHSKKHSKESSEEPSKKPDHDHSKEESKDHSKEESNEHSKESSEEPSKKPDHDHSKEELKDHSKEESKDHSTEESKEHSKEVSKEHSTESDLKHSKKPKHKHFKEHDHEHSQEQSKESDHKHSKEPHHELSKETSQEHSSEHSEVPDLKHSKDSHHKHSQEPEHEHSKVHSKEHSKEPDHEFSKEESKEDSKDSQHKHSKEPDHENSKEQSKEHELKHSKAPRSDDFSEEDADVPISESAQLALAASSISRLYQDCAITKLNDLESNSGTQTEFASRFPDMKIWKDSSDKKEILFQKLAPSSFSWSFSYFPIFILLSFAALGVVLYDRTFHRREGYTTIISN